MKLLRGGLIASMTLALFVVSSPRSLAATLSAGDADGTPHLLTELKFGSTAPMATTAAAVSSEISAPGWNFWANSGGSLGVEATPGPNGIGTVDALEGSYPIPAQSGGSYVGAGYDLSALNTEDIYIEFWAKMPGVKEGCKFVKIFGKRSSSTGYADTTIYTDYTGAQYGAIRQIGFGDGQGLVNDSTSIVDLTGLHNHLGIQAPTAVVETPQGSVFSAADWGAGWHHFRIHVRFNSVSSSGVNVPDGEYYLEIDGKVYVDATGLYNRNPVNLPIQNVNFFGWAQTESQPFQLWYYDIRISTGGFISSPMPSAPTNVAVK